MAQASTEQRKAIVYDPTVSHPLKNKWTWYYDAPPKGVNPKNYAMAMKKVIQVSTVRFRKLKNV